jgi:hypothetical protein
MTMVFVNTSNKILSLYKVSANNVAVILVVNDFEGFWQRLYRCRCSLTTWSLPIG